MADHSQALLEQNAGYLVPEDCIAQQLRQAQRNLARETAAQLEQEGLQVVEQRSFVSRQYRISSESRDFYIYLVYYNYLLKCFVLFDLRSGELTHQDIGQMDMYVRIMDDLKRTADNNPTVGIMLCTHKDASVVRYSVLHENEQILASRYKLVLPSEEEIRKEMERERAQFFYPGDPDGEFS